MAYYRLGVTHNNRGLGTEYKRFETWDEVTDYLRNHIPAWTVCIDIDKRYPCGRLITRCQLTMGNLYRVANSPTDNIVYTEY